MDFLKEHFIAVIIAACLIVNLVGYAMAYSDKKKAQKGKRRIPERTLFFVSLIGGSVGMYLGMKKFRHKTAQKRFMLGIPLMIAFQSALCAVIAVYWLR